MAALEEPDKGYAWVVLFSACIINAILSGMARMIGLLYVAVVDSYGVTRKEASLPFTVRNAVRYLAGPLSGVLGQTYGIRAVSFWGGVVAAAGSILCAFAPNVEWIVFFWGVLHGLGFALSNTQFQVVINQYFEKFRASASGIVLSGSCVCALLFPFMIDALLNEYGMFGCFLLLGGLFLNILPPSLVLKVPPWVEFPEAYARKRALLLNLPHREQWEEGKLPCVSSTTFPKKLKQAELNASMTEIFNGRCLQSDRRNCDQHGVVCINYRSFCETPQQEKITNPQFQTGIDNPAFLHEYKESCIEVIEKRSTAMPPPAEQDTNKFLKNVQEIPLLYLNPIYILISISMATYFTAFLPILAVIVDYSRDKGIPTSYEKFLIYSFTIGDLLGRLAFGWVTDRKYLNFPNFMTLTFIFKGAFLIFLTMSNSLVVNMTVLGLYGITAGIAFAHFPILVHRYVEQDNQTIGIGCIGLFSSVATFGLPPLIGHFRDNVGSYDGLFYIISAISVVTGALWQLVPIYEKIQDKKKKQTWK